LNYTDSAFRRKRICIFVTKDPKNLPSTMAIWMLRYGAVCTVSDVQVSEIRSALSDGIEDYMVKSQPEYICIPRKSLLGRIFWFLLRKYQS